MWKDDLNFFSYIGRRIMLSNKIAFIVCSFVFYEMVIVMRMTHGANLFFVGLNSMM